MDKTLNNLLILTLGFVLITILIISPSNAIPQCGDLIISPNNESINGIIWAYNTTDNIIGASIDGINLENIDNQSGIIQYGSADGRNAGLHTVRIFNEINSGCNTSRILSSPPSETETFFASINLWFLLIVAIILIVVGISIPIVAIAGAVACVIGIVGSFNHSFALGVIFCLCFIAGLIVGLSK